MQSYKQEKREVKRRPEQARAYRVVYPLLLLLVIAVAGCSSNTSSVSNAVGTYNNYAGTQNILLGAGLRVTEGGVWTLTLDDTNNFFSYLNIGKYEGTTPPSPSIGSFATVNGFLDMTLAGGKSGSGGYAIELPGNAVAFRPGDGTQYPVIGVASNSCQSPAANTTYQFVVLVPPSLSSTAVYPAYGSIQATAQGTAWSFSNFNAYTLDGTSVSPAAIPSGTCAYTLSGYAVSIPTTDSAAEDIPYTVGVGPTGYFMADLGQNGFNSTLAYGMVGTVKPSSPLNTSDIVAGKYIGFQYQQLQAIFDYESSSPISLGSATSPIAFGQTAGSGTVMTGGLYPNDDVSQTPPSNITIDLGQQDSQNNGLFKSVTVTIPDPTGSCIARPWGGTDANGNPTCIFPGVAVVGNPGGKYAVYVIANDLRAPTFNDPPSPIEFFLYQQ